MILRQPAAGRPKGQPPTVAAASGPATDLGPPTSCAWRDVLFFLDMVPNTRWAILKLAVCSLAASLAAIPFAYAPKVLIDHHREPTVIYGFLAIATAGQLVSVLLRLLRGWISTHLGETLLAHLRAQVFVRMRQMTMSSVYQEGPGLFVQRLSRDVFLIRDILAETLSEALYELLRAMVILACLVWLQPQVTIVMLGTLLVAFPIIRWTNRRISKFAQRGQNLNEQVYARLVETVAGFRDLQAGSLFARVREEFLQLVDETHEAGRRAGIWANITFAVPAMIMAALLLLPYYMVASPTGIDLPEIANTVTFVLLLTQALPAVFAFTRASTDLAMAGPSLRAIRDIVEVEFNPESGRGAPVADLPTGPIVFQNVTFRAGGSPVLRQVSFTIPDCKLTAIVGPSGAGKTSVLHALLRLVEADEGRIELNGREIRQVTPEQLRSAIGFIPQDPFIFDCSIEANIELVPAGPGAPSVAESIALSQLAGLAEQRQNGSPQNVAAGFLGRQLSAGEKQRIAIARIIRKDPRIVVCDEFTANIDAKTAKTLHSTLHRHFADRTRILVTHEMSVARAADHIIVMDNGAVIHSGQHEELVGNCELYRELCEAQLVV